MIDANYCRLYIDTGFSREETQAVLDEELVFQFTDLLVHGSVFKNDGFGLWPSRAYNPIDRSRWTAEVDSERDDAEAVEVFQAGMSSVIARLRKRGFIITASCDFEDRIAAETGWNWTEDSPWPPSS